MVHGTRPTNVNPTREGAPHLEGTVPQCGAPNREPQRIFYKSVFCDSPHWRAGSFSKLLRIAMPVHHHPDGSVI